MFIKNKIAILTILAAINFNMVNAAAIDSELAVIAAEQGKNNDEKLPEEKPVNMPEKKSARELRAEAKAAEKKHKEELKAAEKAVRDAQKKSRDKDSEQLKISQRDSNKKNFPTVDPVAPKTETVPLEKPADKPAPSNVETFNPQQNNSSNVQNQKPEITQPAQPVQPEQNQKPSVETFTPQQNNPVPVQNQTPAVTQPVQPVQQQQPAQTVQPVQNQPVSLPNPIVMYTNFEELTHALKFTPLYIPKKSGFTINSMMMIEGHTAEIRYGRRWEPEVSLNVRTYKRMNNEELKDISGVYGVKWRVDMSSGTTVYIAKIEENKHVAAWAAGNYTFSAYSENLSFAAFHAIVADELVDLSNHYYL